MANRDELFDRPTAAMDHFPVGERSVLAGRDIKKGGTWLGINDRRIIVAITNNRETPFKESINRSRGELALQVLESDCTVGMREKIASEAANYSNFNLLMINALKGTVEYISNNDLTHPSGEMIEGCQIVLSNGTIHSKWPKMLIGNRLIIEAIRTAFDRDTLIKNLLRVLTDTRQFPSKDLPTNTIFDERTEALLSSIFLRPQRVGPNLFGTVSSSIILIKSDDSIEMMETSWREFDFDKDDFESKYLHFTRNLIVRTMPKRDP